MDIKLLSFQPGSLYENGGAGRVLRRLYAGHEGDVTTLYAKPTASQKRNGLIREVAVPTFPFQRPWMRWHLRTFVTYLRENVFYKYNANRIVRAATEIPCDVVHVIDHGPYSSLLCNEHFSNKPLWVSFHDHFSTVGTFENTKKLWDMADRRLLISEELGRAYQRLFGERDFELITDGVLAREISAPIRVIKGPIRIYFAGLLHIDYHPLFRELAMAIERLNEENIPCELILRGTQELAFLANKSFKIEYRTNFVSDEEIKAEMDEADILYLPMKFNLPDFYLYSLSTKMVSYLGASGAILYHGPKDSAACHLLTRHKAAVSCSSTNAADLEEKIKELLAQGHSISVAAKKLALEEFDLVNLRQRFWQTAPNQSRKVEHVPVELSAKSI